MPIHKYNMLNKACQRCYCFRLWMYKIKQPFTMLTHLTISLPPDSQRCKWASKMVCRETSVTHLVLRSDQRINFPTKLNPRLQVGDVARPKRQKRWLARDPHRTAWLAKLHSCVISTIHLTYPMDVSGTVSVIQKFWVLEFLVTTTLSCFKWTSSFH